MNKRMIALMLALMLAVGGACLADGEGEAPAESATEQSAPAPEAKSESEPEPEPEPEPEQQPATEQESKPTGGAEISGEGTEDEASVGETSVGDASEGEIPPTSNSEENVDGAGSEEDSIGDESLGGETTESEITGDDSSDDEASGDASDENAEDNMDEETDGEDVEASLTVAIEGLDFSDGAWRVPAGTETLMFVWNEIEGAREYAWSIAENGASGSADGGALNLNIADYPAGTYTLTVRAEVDGGSANGSARFVIEGAGDVPGPDEPAGQLAIAAEGASQLEDGTWEFPADSTVLRFTWTAVEGANGYRWSINGSEPQDNQTSTELELSAQDYASGRYTLSIQAVLDGQTVEASLSFEIAQPVVPSAGLTITAEGAQQSEDGAWQFPASAPDATVRFTWTALEGASEYSWQIADAAGNVVAEGNQGETLLELSARDYAAGRFTLTVQAQVDGETVQASLSFELAQTQNPGGFPGRFPGGRHGGFGGFPGGRPSGGAGFDGDMPQEEQGFHVTPGVALTDAHASGSKDMSNYGAANLSLPEAPVAWLALSGNAADVRRADWNSFTAALDEDTLTLSCGDSAAEWVVNPLALTALRLSDVAELELNFGAESVVLPTDLEFTGTVYASYRMQGYVSKDFELHISLRGITAVVDGETYALDSTYELIQM